MKIPAISLSLLRQQDAGTLKALALACQEWGFFHLLDHDLEPHASKHFLASMEAFFNLPKEEKLAVSKSMKTLWGYHDRELTKNRQDWKEIFDLVPDDDSVPWPNQPENFKEVMLDWHQRCESVCLLLLGAIMTSLNLDSDSLKHCFKPKNSSYLRLNHYPSSDSPANPDESYPQTGHLGIHHHTDAGAITLLLQDQVPGLQMRHQNIWKTVPTKAEALVVNIGDMMQVWSNDRYKAPLHRVLANSSQERFSAAFFLNPAYDTNCQPLLEEPPRYRSINWGEFRQARAAGDYADMGEEIQITHYATESI